MALYITLRIESGKMNYNEIFKFKLYQRFQEDVDAMLAADGYTVNADGTVTKGDVND